MSRAASSELAERDVDEDFQGEGGNLRGQDEGQELWYEEQGGAENPFSLSVNPPWGTSRREERPEFDMPGPWMASEFKQGPWQEGQVTIFQGDLERCPLPREPGERVYVLNPANPSLNHESGVARALRDRFPILTDKFTQEQRRNNRLPFYAPSAHLQTNREQGLTGIVHCCYLPSHDRQTTAEQQAALLEVLCLGIRVILEKGDPTPIRVILPVFGNGAFRYEMHAFILAFHRLVWAHPNVRFTLITHSEEDYWDLAEQLTGRVTVNPTQGRTPQAELAYGAQMQVHPQPLAPLTSFASGFEQYRPPAYNPGNTGLTNPRNPAFWGEQGQGQGRHPAAMDMATPESNPPPIILGRDPYQGQDRVCGNIEDPEPNLTLGLHYPEPHHPREGKTRSNLQIPGWLENIPHIAGEGHTIVPHNPPHSFLRPQLPPRGKPFPDGGRNIARVGNSNHGNPKPGDLDADMETDSEDEAHRDVPTIRPLNARMRNMVKIIPVEETLSESARHRAELEEIWEPHNPPRGKRQGIVGFRGRDLDPNAYPCGAETISRDSRYPSRRHPVLTTFEQAPEPRTPEPWDPDWYVPSARDRMLTEKAPTAAEINGYPGMTKPWKVSYMASGYDAYRSGCIERDRCVMNRARMEWEAGRHTSSQPQANTQFCVEHRYTTQTPEPYQNPPRNQERGVRDRPIPYLGFTSEGQTRPHGGYPSHSDQANSGGFPATMPLASRLVNHSAPARMYNFTTPLPQSPGMGINSEAIKTML